MHPEIHDPAPPDLVNPRLFVILIFVVVVFGIVRQTSRQDCSVADMDASMACSEPLCQQTQLAPAVDQLWTRRNSPEATEKRRRVGRPKSGGLGALRELEEARHGEASRRVEQKLLYAPRSRLYASFICVRDVVCVFCNVFVVRMGVFCAMQRE